MFAKLGRNAVWHTVTYWFHNDTTGVSTENAGEPANSRRARTVLYQINPCF